MANMRHVVCLVHIILVLVMSGDFTELIDLDAQDEVRKWFCPQYSTNCQMCIFSEGFCPTVPDGTPEDEFIFDSEDSCMTHCEARGPVISYQCASGPTCTPCSVDESSCLADGSIYPTMEECHAADSFCSAEANDAATNDCGENEQFDSCASSTQPTCSNPQPQAFTEDCRQTCVCKMGFYLNADGQCVDSAACAAETENQLCAKQFHESAGPQPGLIGAYVPQCDFDGSFSPMQCHGSIGQCWCVDPATNVEVEGSRTNPGEAAPQCTADEACGENEAYVTCESSTERTCQIPNPQVVTLDCQSFCSCQFGFYRNSAGKCVDSPTCLSEINDKPCVKEYHESPEIHGSARIGAYRAQCDDNGMYGRVQCHSSTGHCWCADPETNVEIEGTNIGPGAPRPECSEQPTIDCKPNELLAECASSTEATCSLPEPPGYAYDCRTYCTCKEGFYRNAAGECVDATACQAEVADKPCAKFALDNPQSSPPLAGSYRPQCDWNGLYVAGQCHGSTGECWCVDTKTNEEQPDTRTKPGEPLRNCETGEIPDCPENTSFSRCVSSTQPTCSNPNPAAIAYDCNAMCVCNPGYFLDEAGVCVLPKQCIEQISEKHCAKEVLESYAAFPDGNLPSGHELPTCDNNGQYTSLQCAHSTGVCSCVDRRTGATLPGSTAGPGQDAPDCDAFELSLDAKTRTAADCGENQQFDTCASSTQPTCSNPLPQVVAADCRQTCVCKLGFYENSAGKCVDSVVCATELEDQSCAKQFHESAGPEPGLVGTYVPQCDFDGSFRQLQCHGSTGQCWCVNPATNIEVEGSRTDPGDEVPDCFTDRADECGENEEFSSCASSTQPSCTLPNPEIFLADCRLACVCKQGFYLNAARKCVSSAQCITELADDQACARKFHENPQSPSPPPGAFIAQCDGLGKYTAHQCHGSTGQCWCVDVLTNKEVEGTRNNPGEDITDCTVLDGKVVDKPTCGENEEFFDCISSTQAMCVEPDIVPSRDCQAMCGCKSGFYRNAAFECVDAAGCSSEVVDKPCAKFLLENPPMPGAYSPRCNRDGSFRPTQCHSSTGKCWCVDASGEEVEGTRFGIDESAECS